MGSFQPETPAAPAIDIDGVLIACVALGALVIICVFALITIELLYDRRRAKIRRLLASKESERK